MNDVIAIHEAAHATIAQAVGVVVRRVSLADGDPHVITATPRDVPAAERMAALEKLILVDLAGPLAEHRAVGEADLSAYATDERNAFHHALRLVLGQYDLRLNLDEHSIDDTLRAEAVALVNRLRPRAAALVADNWLTINRVAERLLRAPDRMLTGAQLKASRYWPMKAKRIKPPCSTSLKVL